VSEFQLKDTSLFFRPCYRISTKFWTFSWKKREKALQQYLPEFSNAQKEELKYANQSAAISDSKELDKEILKL